MTALEKICPDARGAVLVPENHTRNQFYLQNVATLAKILRHAGMHVRIGSLMPEITRADRDRAARRRQAHARAARAQGQPRRGRRLRPVRRAAQQRPVGGHPGDPARRRAGGAAAAARRLGGAPQVEPLRRLPRSRRGVRRADRHRSVARQSLFRAVRHGSTSTSARARNASKATSPRSSTTCARSTANTASTPSPSSSSRPTPAPTAWAS